MKQELVGIILNLFVAMVLDGQRTRAATDMPYEYSYGVGNIIYMPPSVHRGLQAARIVTRRPFLESSKLQSRVQCNTCVRLTVCIHQQSSTGILPLGQGVPATDKSQH